MGPRLWSFAFVIILGVSGCSEQGSPNQGAKPPLDSNVNWPESRVTNVVTPLSTNPSAWELAVSFGSATVTIRSGLAGEIRYGLPDQDLLVQPLGPGNHTLGFLQAGQNHVVEIWQSSPGGELSLVASVPFTTLANPIPQSPMPTIQPGSYLGTCTLGFILRNATNDTLYALTAGHCFPEGAVVHRYDWGWPTATQRERIGQVVLAKDDGMVDWALIEISAEARPLVSPSLLHWGGPASAWGGTRAGDVACHVGWGQLFAYGVSSTHRCSEFQGYPSGATSDGEGNSTLQFMLEGIVDAGDSGSPVIDEGGNAVGILTSGVAHAATGTTLCGILSLASQAGYDLALLTAPVGDGSMAPMLPPEVPFPWMNLDPEGSCSPSVVRRHLFL